MKKNPPTMRFRNIAICAAAAIAATAAAQVPARVQLARTPDVITEGRLRWVPSVSEYALEYKPNPNSANVVETRYAPKDILNMQVVKPANFEALSAQADGATPDAAIPGLKKIISDYRMLEWDARAAAKIAMIYNKTQRWTDTVALGADMIKDNPAAAVKTDFAPYYWAALIQTGKTDERLNKMIETAIATAPRPVAAAALNIRGDILHKVDKKPKEALADGYLRVALLYVSEKEANAEALYKAATVFTELNQSSYADKMRDRLTSAHSGSPWTKKLLGDK